MNFRALDPAEETFREDNGLACTETEMGDCSLRDCPAIPDTLMEPDGPRLSAGVVTITGGPVDGEPSDFVSVSTPDPTHPLDYASEEEGVLVGGEPLSVEATGGDISAFTGEVSLPLVGYLTSHTAGGSVLEEVEISVPRTEALALTWDTRMSAQTVDVVTRVTSEGDRRTVTCRFDASAGAGTVPMELLSQLDVGTTLYLFSTNRTDLVVPEGTLTLLAAFQLWTEARAGVPLFIIE